MPKKVVDRIPDIPLGTLGILCFVTVFMAQMSFKVSREVNPEMMPPILKNRDSWLFSYGNSERHKFVLKAVMIITSPLLSLFSTGLVLLGKNKMNPYYFLPWIFLTVRGLILIQGNNLLGMLKEVAARTNASSTFSFYDWKWCIFYLTIFILTVAECFALAEVVDLFRIIWFYRPQYLLELKGNKMKYDASLMQISESSSNIQLHNSSSRRTTEIVPSLL